MKTEQMKTEETIKSLKERNSVKRKQKNECVHRLSKRPVYVPSVCKHTLLFIVDEMHVD